MSQSETPVGSMITRTPGWTRFLLVALIIHIPLFIYPVLRIGDWLQLGFLPTILALLLLVPGQIVSRVFLRRKREGWAGWYKKAADFWLGLSPMLLMTLLLFEVLVVLFSLDTRLAAGWVLSLTAVLGLAGSVNAMMPVVKKVPLVSPRLSRPLRIVQITDVHIGSRKPAFLQEVVFRINQQAPDFVCITGDLIDATNVSEDELRALEDLEMPVYFCIGNHEKYEDLDRIIERLQNLGVQVLRNRAVHDDTGVQVIGIDDMDDALQVERQLSHIEVCREDFVVLLYHRPRGLEAAAAAGVDLMLSGHTHNGQIFPFNLIVNQVFDKIEGLYQEGQTFLYVSQGTGTWGPVMRLGTRAEITLFEVSPA